MPTNKERVVLTLGKAAKNELAWIALKNRTTMSRLIEEYVHERFMQEVPPKFPLSDAMHAVAQPDFDVTSTIPFDSYPES